MGSYGHQVVGDGNQITKAQALIVRSAIGMYLKTGIQANRSYTPTAMLKTAGRICGKTYKRGQLALAYDDLGEFAGIPKKEEADV
jgi:hypothetical protein